jgi:hypothetical protein
VGVLPLPGVAQLGTGSLVSVGDEDRIEAEAFSAARFGGDVSFERPRAAKLLAGRRHDHELAHVTRSTVFDSVQPVEEPANGIIAAGARRLDSRSAAERRDLDPGVLAEHPVTRRPDLAAVRGLGPRVLPVALPGLGREVVGVEQADRPARQRRLELPALVVVAGAEGGGD